MTERTPQAQIVWGHKLANTREKLDDIVPWVRRAGQPYYDVFLEGIDTDYIIARWLQRRSSELALRRTRLVIADDRIAGGYIAVAGGDLSGCRQADLLDLAREMGEHSYSDLRARVDSLKDLFAPVEAHDFYLSKLGVSPQMQDRGLDQYLMDDCLHRAKQGGFGRVRVDVDQGKEARQGLYESNGFRPIYRGKACDGQLRYLSMICPV